MAEKVEKAARLREQGMTTVEIAARMGVALSTVKGYLFDPDGSKLKARKDSYRGVCKWCGGRTSGSAGPGRAATKCGDCTRRKRGVERRWSCEQMIEAAQEFARRYGHPPAAADWNAGHPSPAQRERFMADGWPNYGAVWRAFGSWNAMIEAAGFPPRSPHATHGRPTSAVPSAA